MKSKRSTSPQNEFLQNSDLLYKTILNQHIQFIAILSCDGYVLDVNEQYLSSQKIQRDEYIGMLLWESPLRCHSPKWEATWKSRMLIASHQTTPVIAEDIFQSEDGSISYADTATAAIYDDINDDLIGYIVQSLDTTERCLNNNKMKVSENRLQFILENSQIGHWELNLTDHRSERSLRHDQIFGYNTLLSEWTYEMFLEHVFIEDRDEVARKFQYAIKNQTDWRFECRIRLKKEGEIRWILASGGHVFEKQKYAKSMCGIIQDVTDVKRAEIKELIHHAELKILFKSLPDTYFKMDIDGTILDYYANDADDLYIEANAFLGKRMQDVLPRHLADLFQVKIEETEKTQKTVSFEYELMINNTLNYYEARLNREEINNQLICIIRDVTEQNHLKKVLQASQALAKLGSWEQKLVEGGLASLFWSDEMYQIFEYNIEQPITFNKFIKRIHPDDRKKSDTAFKLSIKKQVPYHIEYRLLFSDGRIKFVMDRAEHFYDDKSTHIRSLGTVVDITKRKQEDARLLLSHKVFIDTHEGIIITDTHKAIVEVNPAFCQITGYSREEIIGKNPNILKSGEQGSSFYKEMWQSINTTGHWQGEMWNQTKRGDLYAELMNISSLTDDSGEVTHYVGVFSDITDNKKQQEKINLMAHYDVLTKLPNRSLFIDRFHQAVAHSKRTGCQFVICVLDLDDFKPVNDNYGHDVGDQLLIEVAKRISECIREEDTISRQGGDEFAILLNHIETARQYEKIMQRIHYSLSLPYIIDDIQHDITASSGVTLSSSDDGDIDTLLRHADHAMYQSKLQGKNRFQLYDPDSDYLIIKKNVLTDEIEQALIKHEFQLYYQPKVNMASGKIFGAEALIRWIHPERGLIAPLEFLPAIDGTRLEEKIGAWVISEALQQLDYWLQAGIELEVSVNISSNHLLSPLFEQKLEQCLADYPPQHAQYLQLEILESSSFGDINLITSIIENCQKQLGVSFALDDFGTGYSSLTHLRSLPVDTIKIDQSFVRDMLDDPNDYAIIEGVIALSKSFNRQVIAEGVESTNHGLMLLLMGCEQAQGYQIAKPMPVDVFTSWFNDYIPNKNWLDVSNEQLNNKQISLAVFKLISQRALEGFKSKIQCSMNTRKSWPIFDNQFAHCENWFRREKHELTFPKEFERKLKESHDSVHNIAQFIHYSYQKGDVDTARASLQDLDLAFNAMEKILKQYE